MALLNTKPGSTAAMRQALQSVYSYIDGQMQRDSLCWWSPLPDTIAEVEHALGLPLSKGLWRPKA